MSRWSKKCEFTINYGRFKFEYDTASELGKMIAESDCGMENPYEPDFSEHDEFNEAYWEAKSSSRNI